MVGARLTRLPWMLGPVGTLGLDPSSFAYPWHASPSCILTIGPLRVVPIANMRLKCTNPWIAMLGAWQTPLLQSLNQQRIRAKNRIRAQTLILGS
eukprot:5523702-Pyramimonas_sp.AAC.1